MTTDVLGGVWTYCIELCRALSSTGVRVTLAAMGGPVSRERLQELRTLRNIELHERNYRLEWMENPWSDVDAAGEWLLALAQRERPDLIHLNGYSHAALDWDAPVVAVAHSCVLSWWRAVKGVAAPQEYDQYRRRVVAGLSAADVVIAPSTAMQAEVDRLYGIHAQVIPNGRNPSAFPRGQKHNLVFSAGRLWDEGKNIGVLMEAAKRLAWPMYVAGPMIGPQSQLPRTRGLTLLGNLSEIQIAPWYARAAIYAHPAKYEPFGLSVLEAAISGCALVLADIPSLRENWDGAAIFADPDRPAAWRRALGELMNDPQALRIAQGHAATRARRFNVAAMIRRYLAAYQEANDRFAVKSGRGQMRRVG